MLLSTTKVDNSNKNNAHEQTSLDKLVSMYTEPPSEEITLDEFELYALDRLQLLRGIETLRARGFEEKEYASKLTQLQTKYMPLRSKRWYYCHVFTISLPSFFLYFFLLFM